MVMSGLDSVQRGLRQNLRGRTVMAEPVQVKKRRNVHQTQWAAQFGVASELCKRGYEVSFTMGNTSPLADLMVVSPVGRTMFLIDVKGLYRMNPWLVNPKQPQKDLYYILAYVPIGEPSQFFVMTQSQVNKAIDDELLRLKRGLEYPAKGFLWKLALPYKDAWDVLPA
jgi:hypothetical protein